MIVKKCLLNNKMNLIILIIQSLISVISTVIKMSNRYQFMIMSTSKVIKNYQALNFQLGDTHLPTIRNRLAILEVHMTKIQ